MSVRLTSPERRALTLASRPLLTRWLVVADRQKRQRRHTPSPWRHPGSLRVGGWREGLGTTWVPVSHSQVEKGFAARAYDSLVDALPVGLVEKQQALDACVFQVVLKEERHIAVGQEEQHLRGL